MALGPVSFYHLTSLLVLCVVPSTESLPVRVRGTNPRVFPILEDPVATTTAPPVKPDPLENIGVEPSQGYLIEGDIRIWHGFPLRESTNIDTSSDQKSYGYSMQNSHQLRNSVSTDETWLEKVIPYEIDSTFNSTEKQVILDAINEIMAGVNRCIIFVPREKQEDFLYIAGQDSGCSSSVGKQGGNQTVSISRASQCVSKGIIMHELLHALGFWHEHSRPDRDKYIEILHHNIRLDHIDDFKINPNGKMLTAYDYYSIMHYKTNQFSKLSTIKTIRVIQQGIDETKVGQREYLSDKDKERIVLLYQCKKLLRSSVDSAQFKQYPGNAFSAFRTTPGNHGHAFVPTAENKGNPLEAMPTSPVIDNTGKELNIPVVPQTPAVNTHIEAVSSNLVGNVATETETVLKSNLTETEEIGRK
ncbi:zinc metalloproteinase nas-14-like isoform X2 [Mercenaria mercenaria]|nr:zinc metalloproteinase nas-14-like isoform X2 [Mercenaria mercenaria]XP_053391815.1 zinc metalloproteinase nas-14-like isoform X2 [Mercenaria mercenaria]